MPGKGSSRTDCSSAVGGGGRKKQKNRMRGYLTDGRDEADESPLTPQHEHTLKSSSAGSVLFFSFAAPDDSRLQSGWVALLEHDEKTGPRSFYQSRR